MTTTDSRYDRTADARPHRPRGVSLDATFDALANQQCRALLERLADGDDEVVVVDDLVARLAGDERAPAETASGDRNEEIRLRTQLHHTHLPKLDDAGLLDYDADRGVVRWCDDSRFEAMRSAIAEYEAADHPVSLDALFDLLADFRRRTAIRTLSNHGDLSLPDLADEVAIAERDEPLPEIDPDAVLRVYLSLYHTHVSKLADVGFVTYDQDDDYLTLTEVGRALESPVEDLCAAASR